MTKDKMGSELECGDRVYVRATFIKEFDNGMVRISFAPELDKKEFPVFEINIPKDAICFKELLELLGR